MSAASSLAASLDPSDADEALARVSSRAASFPSSSPSSPPSSFPSSSPSSPPSSSPSSSPSSPPSSSPTSHTSTPASAYTSAHTSTPASAYTSTHADAAAAASASASTTRPTTSRAPIAAAAVTATPAASSASSAGAPRHAAPARSPASPSRGPGAALRAFLVHAFQGLRGLLRNPFTHLYQRVYLATIGAIVLTVLATGLVFHAIESARNPTPAFELFSDLVAKSLPPAGAPLAAQARIIENWAQRSQSRVALYSADGGLIGAGGDKPVPYATGLAALRGKQIEDGHARLMDDGRMVIVQFISKEPMRRVKMGTWLGLVALAVGLALFPIVRRITRRLEDLRSGVEALGEGRLDARVATDGKDEVAFLAESFNRSAARIEALMTAQKTLLANASHELRSPLARIQMAVGLVGTRDDEHAREEINTSIRELDHLIGEILLASRFEAENFKAVIACEPIDLTGLIAEEAARFHIEPYGDHVHIFGDPTLLRRLTRNLLENARRYGARSPVEVAIERDEDAQGRPIALLSVLDRGPGVPEAARDRIFEAFYRVPGSSERDGGVGLGLALVRGIARQHGGDARYEQREGGGACFRAWFPLDEQGAQRLAQAPIDVAARSGIESAARETAATA